LKVGTNADRIGVRQCLAARRAKDSGKIPPTFFSTVERYIMAHAHELQDSVGYLAAALVVAAFYMKKTRISA
jgi:hypothetical protein